MDFSAWNGRLTPQGLQRALDRNMPPIQFTLVHPEARLTPEQKQVLVQGFQASLPANASLPASPKLLLVSNLAPKATEIINARCSACHSPIYALQYRTSSPAKASALIDRMVRHGATVSPSEKQILIDQFTQ